MNSDCHYVVVIPMAKRSDSHYIFPQISLPRSDSASQNRKDVDTILRLKKEYGKRNWEVTGNRTHAGRWLEPPVL